MDDMTEDRESYGPEPASLLAISRLPDPRNATTAIGNL
jgi:hypothetical protein